MDFRQYEIEAGKTAIYPGVGSGSLSAISYCALGLTGEAGEVANKVKKLLRDQDTPEARKAILDEVGDILWYASRLAAELDASLLLVADRNIEKLNRRRRNNTVRGSGDNR